MKQSTSNLLKRVASACVALPIYFYGIITDHLYSIPLLAVSLIVSLACLYEYYQIVKTEERGKPFLLPGMITGGIIAIAMYVYAFGNIYRYNKYFGNFDVRVMLAIIAVSLLVIMLFQIFRRPIEGAIYSLAVTMFGVIYIIFSFNHILFIKALPHGAIYIFLLHLVIMINDSAAYLGGVLFGKHKTGFMISPNKSWEGYFSGMLFSILSMIIANDVLGTFYDLHLFSIVEAAIIGVVLSIMGDLGDLIESAIKRDAKVKDSGSIIPGHGGMWDVFDALIFTFPVFYYYLMAKGV